MVVGKGNPPKTSEDREQCKKSDHGLLPAKRWAFAEFLMSSARTRDRRDLGSATSHRDVTARGHLGCGGSDTITLTI